MSTLGFLAMKREDPISCHDQAADLAVLIVQTVNYQCRWGFRETWLWSTPAISFPMRRNIGYELPASRNIVTTSPNACVSLIPFSLWALYVIRNFSRKGVLCV
jgi:hypothetical protein